ncbi:hypothetical protein [Rickettsiella massiliensis]|uniref:hypothetical protein n=1 Tax=Rickettsiella massiliensis TaxID=676517 RepID=UPI00029B007E|nr:hypothetical protein [Rickettsiella massiliensis]
MGSAIYKLQEIVNKTPDLLSCHFYLIDEQEDTVINYTAKRNTCDPIDVALLASEEMTELLVETKVSTNYHLKRLIIGLFKNSLFNFLRALPLFIISGVIFIFSIFFPFSMLFAWGSLAFVAGLAMLAYYSCKAMNQLIKETKPTKEFGEVTLTKLESSHFSALFSKKLSNLSKHIFSNDKPSKQLSTDKTPSKNKKRLFCECKPKEEEQFELSFNVNHSSEPSDWDRSNSFRVSVENALFDKNKEHSSQQENQDRKIKEKLTLSAGINPFDEEGDLKPIIEQKIIAKITSSVVSPFDEGPNLKSIINTKQITQSSKPKKNLAFNKEKKIKFYLLIGLKIK